MGSSRRMPRPRSRFRGPASALHPWRAEEIATEILERSASAQRHRVIELRAQQLENGRHPILSRRGKSPKRRSSDSDGRGSQRERLDDIRTAPDATVEQQRNSSGHRVRDPGQQLDRRGYGVELAPTVVRNDQRVDAMANREGGILGMRDSLQRDGNL